MAISNLNPIYTTTTGIPPTQVVVNNPNNKEDVDTSKTNLNLVHGVSLVGTNQWGPYFTIV